MPALPAVATIKIKQPQESNSKPLLEMLEGSSKHFSPCLFGPACLHFTNKAIGCRVVKWACELSCTAGGKVRACSASTAPNHLMNFLIS